MFTGLIEGQGEVMSNDGIAGGHRLLVRVPFKAVLSGESIAVNGVCLTALPDEKKGIVAFDLSPETLHLTTLGHCRKGDKVNLERAILAKARLGGHYVSGHVDTTASLQSIIAMEDYTAIRVGAFGIPATRYILPKGSITLDGVSLTINAVDNGSIMLMLVPHTLAMTTFGLRRIGARLNVEFDYLTRVIAHQVDALAFTINEHF